MKQCQHSGKWFNLYQKTSALISLIYENEPFSLSEFFFFAPHPMFEILKKWIEKDTFEFMHILFEKEQIHVLRLKKN